MNSEFRKDKSAENNQQLSAEQLLQQEYIEAIQEAGPMLVVDPEKAAQDMVATLERVVIAVQNGIKIILMGGSTDSGEAEAVVPLLREVIETTESDTLILAFPGSSRQVVAGVDGVLLLNLPQILEVFAQNKTAEEYFKKEKETIITKSIELQLPLIPITYLIFNSGTPTSVEKATGINGLQVTDEESFQRALSYCLKDRKAGEQVFLELGSGPDTWVDLSPIAHAIYKVTGVLPIISGGVNSPEKVSILTRELPYPLGFGSLAEQTRPQDFEEIYKSLRKAHPLTYK